MWYIWLIFAVVLLGAATGLVLILLNNNNNKVTKKSIKETVNVTPPHLESWRVINNNTLSVAFDSKDTTTVTLRWKEQVLKEMSGISPLTLDFPVGYYPQSTITVSNSAGKISSEPFDIIPQIDVDTTNSQFQYQQPLVLRIIQGNITWDSITYGYQGYTERSVTQDKETLTLSPLPDPINNWTDHELTLVFKGVEGEAYSRTYTVGLDIGSFVLFSTSNLVFDTAEQSLSLIVRVPSIIPQTAFEIESWGSPTVTTEELQTLYRTWSLTITSPIATEFVYNSLLTLTVTDINNNATVLATCPIKTIPPFAPYAKEAVVQVEAGATVQLTFYHMVTETLIPQNFSYNGYTVEGWLSTIGNIATVSTTQPTPGTTVLTIGLTDNNNNNNTKVTASGHTCTCDAVVVMSTAEDSNSLTVTANCETLKLFNHAATDTCTCFDAVSVQCSETSVIQKTVQQTGLTVQNVCANVSNTEQNTDAECQDLTTGSTAACGVSGAKTYVSQSKQVDGPSGRDNKYTYTCTIETVKNPCTKGECTLPSKVFDDMIVLVRILSTQAQTEIQWGEVQEILEPRGLTNVVIPNEQYPFALITSKDYNVSTGYFKIVPQNNTYSKYVAEYFRFDGQNVLRVNSDGSPLSTNLNNPTYQLLTDPKETLGVSHIYPFRLQFPEEQNVNFPYNVPVYITYDMGTSASILTVQGRSDERSVTIQIGNDTNPIIQRTDKIPVTVFLSSSMIYDRNNLYVTPILDPPVATWVSSDSNRENYQLNVPLTVNNIQFTYVYGAQAAHALVSFEPLYVEWRDIPFVAADELNDNLMLTLKVPRSINIQASEIVTDGPFTVDTPLIPTEILDDADYNLWKIFITQTQSMPSGTSATFTINTNGFTSSTTFTARRADNLDNVFTLTATPRGNKGFVAWNVVDLDLKHNLNSNRVVNSLVLQCTGNGTSWEDCNEDLWQFTTTDTVAVSKPIYLNAFESFKGFCLLRPETSYKLQVIYAGTESSDERTQYFLVGTTLASTTDLFTHVQLSSTGTDNATITPVSSVRLNHTFALQYHAGAIFDIPEVEVFNTLSVFSDQGQVSLDPTTLEVTNILATEVTQQTVNLTVTTRGGQTYTQKVVVPVYHADWKPLDIYIPAETSLPVPYITQIIEPSTFTNPQIVMESFADSTTFQLVSTFPYLLKFVDANKAAALTTGKYSIVSKDPMQNTAPMQITCIQRPIRQFGIRLPMYADVHTLKNVVSDDSIQLFIQHLVSSAVGSSGHLLINSTGQKRVLSQDNLNLTVENLSSNILDGNWSLSPTADGFWLTTADGRPLTTDADGVWITSIQQYTGTRNVNGPWNTFLTISDDAMTPYMHTTPGLLLSNVSVWHVTEGLLAYGETDSGSTIYYNNFTGTLSELAPSGTTTEKVAQYHTILKEKQWYYYCHMQTDYTVDSYTFSITSGFTFKTYTYTPQSSDLFTDELKGISIPYVLQFPQDDSGKVYMFSWYNTTVRIAPLDPNPTNNTISTTHDVDNPIQSVVPYQISSDGTNTVIQYVIFTEDTIGTNVYFVTQESDNTLPVNHFVEGTCHSYGVSGSFVYCISGNLLCLFTPEHIYPIPLFDAENLPTTTCRVYLSGSVDTLQITVTWTTNDRAYSIYARGGVSGLTSETQTHQVGYEYYPMGHTRLLYEDSNSVYCVYRPKELQQLSNVPTYNIQNWAVN